MKIAVIGSRHATEEVSLRILQELPANVSEIVSGGAAGVDHLAEQVAESLGIPLRLFLPDYERYGKQAPLVRNEQIVDYADQILAFWDGLSRGTGHTISLCIKKNKPVRIISSRTSK